MKNAVHDVEYTTFYPSILLRDFSPNALSHVPLPKNALEEPEHQTHLSRNTTAAPCRYRML